MTLTRSESTRKRYAARAEPVVDVARLVRMISMMEPAVRAAARRSWAAERRYSELLASVPGLDEAAAECREAREASNEAVLAVRELWQEIKRVDPGLAERIVERLERKQNGEPFDVAGAPSLGDAIVAAESNSTARAAREGRS